MAKSDADKNLSVKMITDVALGCINQARTDKASKVGILLCEGDDNSIDKAVYSLVFPELCIVPVGGCSIVSRYTPKIRNNLLDLGIYVFGIIDRDALSKREIKNLNYRTGVYTTKLPFIENIICAPETLEIVCDIKNLDFELLLNKIETELLKTLWQKMKEALPINLGVEKNERIKSLCVGVETRKKQILKVVSKDNILYSYRDKIIVSIVGNALGLQGKKPYYNEIMEMMKNPDYSLRFAKVFSGFIPKLEFYDLEYEILHP